ncbi:MAG TPA: IPT/TIG domain-containing protein, partial [Puia sp.]
MKSSNIIIPAIFYLFLMQLSDSCKKSSVSNNPPPPVSAITITGVLPNSGKHGDTIIITGTHFNLNTADDTVKFNGKTAVVQKASADTLFVIVPLSAGTGAVTVNKTPAPGPVFDYIPIVMVSTFAGGGMQNMPGSYVIGEYVDGPDSIARFTGPIGICLDVQGNMYVVDDRIRKISMGFVSTFAGSGINGFLNGPDSVAEFFLMAGIAIDAQSSLYVSDEEDQRIRKISAGMVTTFAGSGAIGSKNGPDTTAQFYGPATMAFDAQGYLYVGESNDIRKISPSGVVNYFAGGGTLGVGGYLDGPDTTARFNNILGVALDAQGNVYVADNINTRIRKVTPSGVVSTFAGSGIQGIQDGPADSAQFYFTSGICLDSAG